MNSYGVERAFDLFGSAGLILLSSLLLMQPQLLASKAAREAEKVHSVREPLSNNWNTSMVSMLFFS